VLAPALQRPADYGFTPSPAVAGGGVDEVYPLVQGMPDHGHGLVLVLWEPHGAKAQRRHAQAGLAQ